MKKIFLALLALLIVCSCAKNYPEMVKDRVEQYKKEGKVILSQSNDETGKEHYIVYADAKSQVIGVDTLGKDVKEIRLGKKPYVSFEVKVDEKHGLKVKKEKYEDAIQNFYITASGKISDGYDTFRTRVYKDKYIVFVNRGFGLFLNDDNVYYNLSEKNMGDDGNIHLVFHNIFDVVLPKEWQNYMSNSQDLYIDRYHSDLVFKATVSPEGKIISHAKSAYCSGVEIPVEMFSDWLTLRPYIVKVVQLQNLEESNWDE